LDIISRHCGGGDDYAAAFAKADACKSALDGAGAQQNFVAVKQECPFFACR
jgi:hypothetical protein